MPMPKTVGSQSCQYTFTINNRFIFILFQQQSQHHQQRFTSSCLVASYIYRSPAIQAKDEVRLKKKKTEASWSNLFGVEVDKFLEQLEHLADTQLLSSYSIRAGMVGDFWSQLYIIHVFSTIPLLLQLVYEFILYFILGTGNATARRPGPDRAERAGPTSGRFGPKFFRARPGPSSARSGRIWSSKFKL